jgi:Ser/Thr protein kinase RdoA (MazF antagonist)
MMTSDDLPLATLLELLETLVADALPLWDIPAKATVRLINVSENCTYLIEAGEFKAVLRVHRENYHSRRAIACELAWLDALACEGVIETPGYFRGRNGEAIQEAETEGLASKRFLVLFKFVEGAAPDESGDMTAGFKELGAIAARCHDHVLNWEKPSPFERLTWDAEAVFGDAATWGNWRDAPGVDETVCATLEQVEAKVRNRLAAYGKAPGRYNLIHADMRLANLLVAGPRTRVIDFDDCGWGWFMYDFAAAISFMEDDARVPALKAAWLAGYRSVRALPAEDEAEIDTMIMLRRMALLAWIGSHIEAPEPQALAPHFARTTAKLGQAYLQTAE